MLLALMAKSWKSLAWKMSKYSSSFAIIKASIWPWRCSLKNRPNSWARTCLSRRSMMEPSFTPMRMGMPRSLHASMTASTCTRSLMLPGLSRILCTPASTASRARLKWKCTSATMGTLVRLRISGSASVSFFSGTATRTMSAPAACRRLISATDASTSWVNDVVMVWRATGAPPPTSTMPVRSSPIRIRRVRSRCMLMVSF